MSKPPYDGPFDIDNHNWYYLDRDGLAVIHETVQNGKHVKTDQIIIPWDKLREALKLKDGA